MKLVKITFSPAAAGGTGESANPHEETNGNSTGGRIEEISDAHVEGDEDDEDDTEEDNEETSDEEGNSAE